MARQAARSRSCSSGAATRKGDTVVWLPQEKILFSGDLVEYDATPYTGDAYLADWPTTLDNDRGARRREARARPRRGADRAGAGHGRPRRHARVRHRDVRRGEARRRRGQGPAHRLQGDLRGAEAEVRPLGDLRPLPAVRRDARLRRGDRSIPIRASGPRSATRRCGRRWKAERERGWKRTMEDDYLKSRSSIRRSPDQDAG